MPVLTHFFKGIVPLWLESYLEFWAFPFSMPFPAVQDIVQVDLFASEDELRAKYPTTSVDRVLRLRAMYNWFISNPDSKDKEFVDECISRYGISKTLAYDDLKVIKSVLPLITQASRDYHGGNTTR